MLPSRLPRRHAPHSVHPRRVAPELQHRAGHPPERPGDDVSWLNASLREAGCDAADFLDRPSDDLRRVRVRLIRVFGGGGALARHRMVASMAKASIASET